MGALSRLGEGVDGSVERGYRRSIRQRMERMTLPPGQHPVAGSPRFGTHLHRPPPAVPRDHAIEVAGAVTQPLALPREALASLPRREITADFHCVAGWSATGLRWEGVPFAELYRRVLEPAIRPGVSITHVAFQGLDRYRSFAAVEDVLQPDVLLAEHLDGRPLDLDHGAPVRLVSPDQYGFVSTKHLCRVELHTAEPERTYHPARFMQSGLRLVTPHPRARVWQEERHRHL